MKLPRALKVIRHQLGSALTRITMLAHARRQAGILVIRLVLAKTVYDFMDKGKGAQEAAEVSVALVNKRIFGVYNDVGSRRMFIAE